MNDERTAHHAKPWVIGLGALALILASCAGGDPSSPATGGSAASAAAPIDTQIAGEQFSSLSVSADKVSGVFVRGTQSLAFEVEHRKDTGALRLSSTAGDALYSVVHGPAGSELRIGASYRSFLPALGQPAAQAPADRNASPSGFDATGDLKAALDGLKDTPVALLPYLAAALGRVGLDGSSAPTTLTLHLTAERLTEDLGLEFDPAVVAVTNQIISARTPAPGAAEAAPDSPPANTPGTLHTAGFTPTGLVTCPLGKPPCASGKIVATSGLFAGCCISPATPSSLSTADYSNTPSCSSGAARETFRALDYNPVDPCRDGCLGMCGPGCSPWYWVCQDEAVHAACWNHDRAYCPTTIRVWPGITLPNPDWPICYAEYVAYTALIGADTTLGPLCANNGWTDFLTSPPPGLWTQVPGYYVRYK